MMRRQLIIICNYGSKLMAFMVSFILNDDHVGVELVESDWINHDPLIHSITLNIMYCHTLAGMR